MIQLMGDLFRRVAYPMLLPAIVGIIWMHAWVKANVPTEPGYHLPPIEDAMVAQRLSDVRADDPSPLEFVDTDEVGGPG